MTLDEAIRLGLPNFGFTVVPNRKLGDDYGRGPMMQATEPQPGATDFRKRPDGVWEMPE